METLRYTAHIDLQLLKPIASKSFSQMKQHVLSRQEKKRWKIQVINFTKGVALSRNSPHIRTDKLDAMDCLPFSFLGLLWPREVSEQPITLDCDVLPQIPKFEQCLEKGESSTLGPFIHLLVKYSHGDRGVVKCPHSFFRRSASVRERLKPLLTDDQWGHMDSPFSNYRLYGGIRVERVSILACNWLVSD